MEKNIEIQKKKLKASTEITLRCKEVGLEKKVEFAHSIYKDPVKLPEKGTIIKYKDRNSPRLDGTYEVKQPYWDLIVGWGAVVRLQYILDLKKIE